MKTVFIRSSVKIKYAVIDRVRYINLSWLCSFHSLYECLKIFRRKT